jgi:hypothetical protein
MRTTSAWLMLWGGVLTAGAEDCAPTPACQKHRECTFGTVDTYEVVRNALFSATGRSLACADACECIPTASNRVQSLRDEAAADPALYANNTVCNNPKLHAAMVYITGGYACETVFAEAQVPLFQLCGIMNGGNGEPCQNKCNFQYEIDVPVPPCQQRAGPQATANYVVTGLMTALAILWMWVPMDVPDTTTQHHTVGTGRGFQGTSSVRYDKLVSHEDVFGFM